MDSHIDLARDLAGAIGRAPACALDLGSGAGIPGLVLALEWPASSWVLLDAGERRTVVLAEAVERLGLADRVEVVCQRAEVAGRDPRHRGGYDLVTARSFGAPAVTAECGAPLLRVGGVLAVTEPPDAHARWPAAGLELLGLSLGPSSDSPNLQQLLAVEACPDRYPRRVGVPAKRPLF